MTLFLPISRHSPWSKVAWVNQSCKLFLDALVCIMLCVFYSLSLPLSHALYLHVCIDLQSTTVWFQGHEAVGKRDNGQVTWPLLWWMFRAILACIWTVLYSKSKCTETMFDLASPVVAPACEECFLTICLLFDTLWWVVCTGLSIAVAALGECASAFQLSLSSTWTCFAG